MTRDERYISMALELAEKALKEGEIPVGAVVVCGDTVVGRGYNRTGESALSTAHAEIIAIEEANGIIGTDKLDGCELFSTLEPCVMCTGAAMNARIRRIVFGAFDTDAGALGGKEDLSRVFFRHSAEIIGGVLEERCKEVLQQFFREKRSVSSGTVADYGDVIGRTVSGIIDRPAGSRHPEHEDIIYTTDYGYIEGIIGGDGEEQDAFVFGLSPGEKRFRGTVCAVYHRTDDCEDKWIVSCGDDMPDRETILKNIWCVERFFTGELCM